MSKKLEPGMAYDTQKLNKIFAFLSILFLGSVIWVFIDDYARPWKLVQIQARKIKRQKLIETKAKAEAKVDQAKLKDLKDGLTKANAIVAERRTDISKIRKDLKEIQKKIKAETIINGTLNSQVSAWTFKAEGAHSHHDPKADKYMAIMKDYKRKFAESKDRMKGYQAEEKKIKKQIEFLMREETEANKEIKKLTGSIALLENAIAQTDMGPIFAVRNAPLIDYLDPTLKIQQIVLDNITDDRYFQHVPKVDRCITCHTFIDKRGFEDQKNPFKTHPNLDLMVGMNSPHPMKKTGCTSCHGGEGHRVNDFSAPAHTPQNAKQAKEWKEKYGWHPPHKVPQPMFKLQNTEAGCVKCHTGSPQYLPQATALNEGRRNIEKFGCYGCHKLEGWSHKRKPGPALTKISSKISKEFFKNWVWDPFSFNKHSRMPRFFEQSNNSKHQFVVNNIAEVNAMAEFVWEKSKAYRPFDKFKGGDAAKGKELIKTVGCMGCHGVEGFEEESKKINAHAAPYLTGIGSKVDSDWLVSWLKRPSHYQEDTIMPSFRLSDGEANDITAYLMSLKNEKFEKLKFSKMDKTARDEILVSYFSAFDTDAAARAKLAKMSDRERTMELGHRSVGKYGCYSCHDIDGFQGRAPIGPELSTVGSKPLTQFGFGHQYQIEHSRHGWIKAHLLEPRRWDIGVDKVFGDLNRMPNYYMSEEEAQSITVALLGQVSDYIPLAGVKRMSAEEKMVAEGMKVVNKFNCTGCHKVDEQGGDILAIFDEDINEGPPMLLDEGHRIQADWFHHFLDNVYPIRPWLSIRMPSFKLTDADRNAIVSMFQHKSKQDTFVDRSKVVEWAPGEKEQAKQLFENLDCASCHTAGFNSEEPTAPNLYFVRRRLRPSWVAKWLENPQAIYPETVMPNFWEGGEAQDPDLFGGDPKKQIDALVKYMYDIGTEKLPNNQTKFWSKQ
jgi:cytochrome c2